VKEACDQVRAAMSDPSKQFSTPEDPDFIEALDLVEDFASVSTERIALNVSSAMRTPQTFMALT